MELNINKIFDDIFKNLNDDKYIDTQINIICDNFYNMNYNLFIMKIIENLDDSTFIINFINKLFNKLSYYNNLIIPDIIKNTNNQIHIKHIFLLDISNYKTLLDIYNIKEYNINEYFILLEWIYEIGKINIIFDLIEKLIKKSNIVSYNKLFVIILSLIKFHEKTINSDFYIDFTKKLLSLMNIILSIFELTELIKNIFMINENHDNIINEKITYIFTFYKTIIKYKNIYFKYKIVNHITKMLNLLLTINENIDENKNIIDDILQLLYTDIINIHEKTSLFIDIAKLIIDKSFNYIPKNLIEYIDYFITKIKFISWSELDEKIILFELISKLLLLLKNNEQLFFTDYDNMLYNILYLESECFNVVKIILNTEVLYSNYNIIKSSLYNLITILNIYNDVLNIYFDLCKTNNKYYADLLHKNNLITNTYIIFFNNRDNKSIINKFNVNILFNTIIINKLLIIYRNSDYDEFPIHGLEYDILIEYYKKYNINILINFIDKINELKIKYEQSNVFIEKLGDDKYVDNIFSIEIINPIMIPKSNTFFEKSTMYLLLRETKKNPYTREELELNDVIEYNKQIDIKNKIDTYLFEKKNIL